MNNRHRFEFRGVYECGWNVFIRNGYSTDPRDISVNYRYIDHLSEAGINWLIVFWTNGRSFDAAWKAVADYAHSKGIKVARGMYAYTGGGPEHTMAEPDAPPSLLRTSPKGERTALCPFESESRAWMHAQLPSRLEPGMDGIFIEPARMVSRNCVCPSCSRLLPYEWDVMVLNDLADEIRKLNNDIPIFPYVYMTGGREEKKAMAAAYAGLRHVDHIFAWGADDEETLIDWLEADPRFELFTKLGRVQLFPKGFPPQTPAEERAALVFRWCRLAAERGRSCYLFDYRIFGGTEWPGNKDGLPVTRISDKVPASLKLIGAAMSNPFLDAEGQRRLIAELRRTAEWDLDDPRTFYLGAKRD